MQWRKNSQYIILLALIAAALTWGFWPRPVAVDIVLVKRGPLIVTVEEEGKTRVIDRYEIFAPVAGYLHRVELDVGDSVEKDQTLLEMEPLKSEVLDPRSEAQAKAGIAAAQSALHAARENTRAARAEADYAKTDLQRFEKLAKTAHVSRDALDKAATSLRSKTAALRSAEFAVDVARYELDAARTLLQYSAAQVTTAATETVSIRSPVNGSVLEIHHECEGTVNAGQALLEVGDTQALEVEIDLLSEDAVRILPGMEVKFERWGGEKPLQGLVRIVEPVGHTKISALGVEEQRVLIIADIISPREQWQKLGDGYRVEAGFILWQGSDVLQVPASALFRYKGDWALFVIKDSKARRRIVQTGQHSGLFTQVLEGVEEDEVIISHPDDSIEDGTAVKKRHTS